MSLRIKKITKVFNFSLYESWIMFKSWFMYVKWDYYISVISYKNWQKHVINQKNTATNKLSSAKIQRLIQLNEIAGRNHLRQMNCLRRCLCQKELLNGFNVNTQLHFGVKFVEGKLAAHAWLSVNNTIINDSNHIISTYKELKTLTDTQTFLLLK